MSCGWTWVLGQSWVWWLLLGQVVGVAGLVCFGVGYVVGADRWVDRARASHTRK